MLHLILTTAILAAFWLLLAGVYTALILFFGSLSVLFVVYLIRRMDVIDHESHPFHLGLGFPRYIVWLVWEVIKSNVDVAKRILTPDLDISPTLLKFKAYQKTELGRVIYANSITLTPGTICLRLTEQGDMVVHAISRHGAENLQTGKMDRQIAKLGMDDYAPIEQERGLNEARPQAKES